MADDARALLLEAKNNYQKILIQLVYKPIYQGIRSYWEEAKTTCRQPKDALECFQVLLQNVKKLNEEVLERMWGKVVKSAGRDYDLQDLIKKVILLNTQILAAVDPSPTAEKIRVKVPKGTRFIHEVYKECARAFFEMPWLLEDRREVISCIEQAKNLQKSYKIIWQCIENTIRSLLPIESLMNKSLNHSGEDGDVVTPPHYLLGGPAQFGWPQIGAASSTSYNPALTGGGASGMWPAPPQPQMQQFMQTGGNFASLPVQQPTHQEHVAEKADGMPNLHFEECSESSKAKCDLTRLDELYSREEPTETSEGHKAEGSDEEGDYLDTPGQYDGDKSDRDGEGDRDGESPFTYRPPSRPTTPREELEKVIQFTSSRRHRSSSVSGRSLTGDDYEEGEADDGATVEQPTIDDFEQIDAPAIHEQQDPELKQFDYMVQPTSSAPLAFRESDDDDHRRPENDDEKDLLDDA